ncbi:TauD/TfdA family dioxygenase [Candidatus Thioglobus sp.]|uniref:TauD/TfdA family dioxygenase n=1 Tax=Candidatus Thioglobus sp. TaxID=2026721 RepID=UPI0026039BA0|nr:TauD/TfdA family dioxygenase [Candidatus Thioglobus sp.]MDG2394747.1 TauD/TfdA family dioxygenase [Candidatus Thioglobus sp.]
MANVIDTIDKYQYWRDEKLAKSVSDIDNCTVEINKPEQLSTAEKDKLLTLCRYNNFAIFQTPQLQDYESKLVSFNQQLNLVDFDQHLYVKNQGLARITPSEQKDQAEFIPYTDRAIGWHTDGYYNASEHRIRAFTLFCVNAAESGGENQWIDHQMVYLLLREENPDITKALTHPKAMSIPEHKVAGVVRRKTSTGPIFFIDEITEQLSMRYTQRKKNINLYNSTEIKQAVKKLDELLNTNSPYHFSHRMHSNQGIICNNILHKRSAFTDNQASPRLMLRGRYFNQIQ